MKCLDFEDPLDTLLENSEPLPGCMDYHTPVLADEVVTFLRPAPGILFLDGTLGGGGHAERLLMAGSTVIGLDRDAEALAHASERLDRFGARFSARAGNYRDVAAILDSMGVGELGGALIDIGVSSHQLDTAERGFSLMKDGPLDMRMDTSAPVTAAQLVNHAPADELLRIFREYGEESAASRIVAHLVTVRAQYPIETTGQLAAVVSEVVGRYGRRHPATRVFQALRIAVNDELESLRSGLEAIAQRLARGARFGVITFHSLEDRIVKRYFKERSAEWIDRPEWPRPKANPDRLFRLLTPHPIDPCQEEVAANPRSRSAKMRVVERL